MDMTTGYTLIDPPVGPYSPSSEILSWIHELSEMEARPEVLEAIEQAKGWLDHSRKHGE